MAEVPQPDGLAVPLLEARGLVKRYGSVQALDGASFSAYPGEVVGLMGDNGAGKSTLIKVLSGVETADGGEVLHNGRPIRLASPQDARDLGIGTVFQDLALAPELDAPANLYLGRELIRHGLAGLLGLLDRRAMRRKAADVFASLGRRTQGPGSAGRHAVRRAAAERRGGPRRHMGGQAHLHGRADGRAGRCAARAVLEHIRTVRGSGRSVVLISHSLPEVFAVADRVEVLRLGRRVARFTAADTTIRRSSAQ